MAIHLLGLGFHLGPARTDPRGSGGADAHSRRPGHRAQCKNKRHMFDHVIHPVVLPALGISATVRWRGKCALECQAATEFRREPGGTTEHQYVVCIPSQSEGASAIVERRFRGAVRPTDLAEEAGMASSRLLDCLSLCTR